MTRDRRIYDHQHLGPGDGGRLPTGAIAGIGASTTVATTSGGAANLNDLGDVDLVTTPPSDLDALTYDAVSGKWIPAAGGGGSPNLDGGLATSTYGGIAALNAGGA